MRQSGHWQRDEHLEAMSSRELVPEEIANLDVVQAREEVRPFVSDPAALTIWFKEFFAAVAARIWLIPEPVDS